MGPDVEGRDDPALQSITDCSGFAKEHGRAKFRIVAGLPPKRLIPRGPALSIFLAGFAASPGYIRPGIGLRAGPNTTPLILSLNNSSLRGGAPDGRMLFFAPER